MKALAVQEMMNRIKRGVVLRPMSKERPTTGQDSSKRRSDAVSELQNVLAMGRRPLRRGSRRRSSQKGQDTQLSAILQRRRRLVDVPGEGPAGDGGGVREERGPAPGPLGSEKVPAENVRLRQRTGALERGIPRLHGAGTWRRSDLRLKGASSLEKDRSGDA
ncbi:shootin-1-like [Ornithorhynchus anatinus]|uniref:shootin-1-like n=1 Tax=Ornithorhynchus anatinus TaxID=9258 RepID=UPI0007AA740A|nr:shootin-1-like [Ornithorhynchus anatinus]